QALWRHPEISTGAYNQCIDGVGLLEHPGERMAIDLLGLGHRPRPDRVRQAEQRSPMRHVGERKAALAVGLDRRRPREVQTVRVGLLIRHGLVRKPVPTFRDHAPGMISAWPAPPAWRQAHPARWPGWCRRR